MIGLNFVVPCYHSASFKWVYSDVKESLCVWVFSCSVMSDSFVTPLTVACQALCPWDFTGKNTGMSSHFLLQGIFLIQGSNPHFQLGRKRLRQSLNHCTTREAPNIANGWKVPWLSHHIASEDCPRSSGQRFPISLTWNWGFDVRVFKRCWDFPGSPVVKTLPSNVPGVGLVPGQGAKIPHALRPKSQN